MPISGYVVKAGANRIAEIRRRIRDMDGVELGPAVDGQFALAAYSEDENGAERFGESLSSLPGVDQALLVYHNFEDVEYTG